MVDRTARTTWLVIGIVLAGVVIVSNLPDRGFAADLSEHPRMAAILGSAHRESESQVFKGADMTAMMGSCSLDLTRATMARGATATVDIFAMMGSVTIRVPDAWTVDAHAVPVMGGIRDQRWRGSADSSEPAAGDPPHLVLRGLVMMGSLFLKS
jgi:hypothetical protein